MQKIFALLVVFFFFIPSIFCSNLAFAKLGKCEANGKLLYGKVKIVNSFPDIKVKKTRSFPDLKVKVVDSFPNSCGKWQFVDSFPDFTIQYVDNFPDITIQFVDYFPGI